MSWVTVIWSAAAGICLTLAGVHFLVWAKSRGSWANLFFCIAALSAAIISVFELRMMHAPTPEVYHRLLRWSYVPGGVMVASTAWFVRFYLRGGRIWLIWVLCACRALILVLNFTMEPGLHFRKITSLDHIHFWGETVVVPVGVQNPWAYVANASTILVIIISIDAAIAAWRRGNRRQAAVVAGTITGATVLGIMMSCMLAAGMVRMPYTLSLVFLIIVLGMAYELSVSVINAAQLSKELFKSRERMRLATHAANLGVWEWDVIRDEIWVTEAIRSRLGLRESEHPNLDRFFQSLHPDDREATMRVVREALEAGKDFQAEYRSIGTSGEVRWIAARGQVERGANGKPLRIRGVSIDITERKQAEVEMQKLLNELAHVSRVSTMGQLSTALAHELNQPLGAILSNADAAEMLLDAEPPALDKVREILADIRKDDERAGEVIRRMRALLRKREMGMVPLDLGELVQDVVRLTSGDAALRKVSVRVKVDSPPLPTRGDRVHLQQVLLNLILNGMEAVAENPLGKRQVIVQAGRNRAGEIEVSVSDNGPGIPADQLSRLFEPFFTTKPNGMGIGTSIARTIIQAHHGRICAENNPEGGATFRFTLPIDEKPESRQNVTVPSLEQPTPVKR